MSQDVLRQYKNVLSVSDPCLITMKLIAYIAGQCNAYYFHNCTTVTRIYFCNKIERMSYWWVKI